MNYWMFIIEFLVQHSFGCTCVKQDVLSTKYPYVDAIPSTGNIPISNHVLAACFFFHHPGTTNMWQIYQHGVQRLSLNHVVYHNTYHHYFYKEYYILLHHTMLVLLSTF